MLYTCITPRPEPACELALGSDDGKWVFESVVAVLQNKSMPKAA